ncbi:uncharacterized protein LOC129956699 [Argiope bruennichi]|uniref:uncharacterized protein LOC129956699 n=1 Tax=Argiope bruennichi TaxID=94029 RepID=UPI00249549A0|nr:uncharacterized protein LOC129956699 [Argiope bruennichi]
MESLLTQKLELWCLAFRDETIRGHNTNNFLEVAIRIFKDVLSQVKSYNVITSLGNYYSRRLKNSLKNGPNYLQMLWEKFDSSEQVLEKAARFLEKITSEGQWETILATLSSKVPLNRKAGLAIRVQPTSIA